MPGRSPYTSGGDPNPEDCSPAVLRRSGYDATTPSDARNIPLVTPGLTRWSYRGTSYETTGHIGVLKLRIVPEPGARWLLAAGLGALLRRRRCAGRRSASGASRPL